MSDLSGGNSVLVNIQVGGHAWVTIQDGPNREGPLAAYHLTPDDNGCKTAKMISDVLLAWVSSVKKK